ncbi:MAG TPA: alpha/beta hydrolase [Steroidobacteraceae bacterium]|nr:alpha/beta hydrolase [Steroidobacteraceae bacterium]
MNIDNDFLDREYNPRVQIPAFADFFVRWKQGAQQARDSTAARLDLAYGTAAAETLDFFPAAKAGAPLLIFIHGGYWRVLDKADFSWVAPPYVAADISVAVLNYGLAPRTPMAEIVNQVRRACTWLYVNAAELGCDRRRIFCSGHSAGGHLTGMMLATDWPALSAPLPKRLLAGALAVSGVFDLRPLTHVEFLRRDLGLDEQSARALSPAFLPLHNEAPLLRALGAQESGEFHRQSELIAAHWPSITADPLLDVPDCNHFSVCDALATPGNALFEAWRAAIGR